jgi:heme exporter protein CcmB
VAPAIVLVMALAALLALDRMFQADAEDGNLDQHWPSHPCRWNWRRWPRPSFIG